jgi:subtilase family serine protease
VGTLPVLAQTATPPFKLPVTATLAASPSGPTGKSPAQIRKFYGLDNVANTGSGQVIGIVVAYDHPNIEADLATFVSEYRLTACTTANGCFKKVYTTGTKPASNSAWALEAALDVEWAHAIAPAAKIVLVEAASSAIADLLKGVDVAVQNGATVVSMSFGAPEYAAETNDDYHFNIAGVTFVAAAGNSGSGIQYPASSAYVLSVGGTAPAMDSRGRWQAETAWGGSGGGLSAFELIPSYQSGLPISDANSFRGQPDVAYIADPNSGFSVYDSIAYNGAAGWFKVGGTSSGTAQWAAMAAIVNSLRVAARKQPLNATAASSINALVYKLGASAIYAANYRDITTGTNGACGQLCTAAVGYDYITGLGSPKADALINNLAAEP